MTDRYMYIQSHLNNDHQDISCQFYVWYISNNIEKVKIKEI